MIPDTKAPIENVLANLEGVVAYRDGWRAYSPYKLPPLSFA